MRSLRAVVILSTGYLFPHSLTDVATIFALMVHRNLLVCDIKGDLYYLYLDFVFQMSLSLNLDVCFLKRLKHTLFLKQIFSFRRSKKNKCHRKCTSENYCFTSFS